MSTSSARQPRAGTVIPILPPPAAEPEACDAVMAGETAEVRLHDGAHFTGSLQKFLRAEQRLLFCVEGGTTQAVPFSSLRLFELPASRSWRPVTPQAAGGQHPAGSPVTYRIGMKDGQTLEGTSLGYRRDSAGLYLYPLREDDSFTHLFIPHTSTEAEHFEPCTLHERKRSGTGAAPAPERATREVIESSEELEELIKRQRHAPKQRLGEILLKESLITKEQLEEALQRQRAYRKEGRNVQIGQVLMELGTLDLSNMMHALSERLGIPFIDLDRFRLNPEAVQFIPEELVRKHRLLPIHRFDNKMVVALENPMDWEALDAVRFQSGLHVEQVMASRDALDRLIGVLYSGPDLQASLSEYAEGEEEEEDEERDHEYDESAVQDNVIVKMVNRIILDACQQRASDIHIEPYPGKAKTVVRIRKDGALKRYYEVPGRMRNALIARIKIMADLDISEKRKPQDGKIDFRKFGPLRIELRVATIPTSGDQEDVVMRILASGEPVPLDDLGLSERNAATLRRMVARPYGLFLVCGPTGSGKTTTLHSVLGYLNTGDCKIWTAEDPVEITQRGLRQVVVKPKIGLTFAAAMRAFLRADPDIIMVGEMRDRETTSMGIEASLTGHLVLSTLHTNTAPETITRLLDMGMDPFNFADALVGILAQRLTRRLCKACKEAYEPDADELNGLVAEYCFELLPKQASEGDREALHARVASEWRGTFAGDDGRFTLYRAKGCPSCDGTGYSGRLGIHELLDATEVVKKKILAQASVPELFDIAVAEGMRTLKQDGVEKVLQGLTDIQTVRKVCIR